MTRIKDDSWIVLKKVFHGAESDKAGAKVSGAAGNGEEKWANSDEDLRRDGEKDREAAEENQENMSGLDSWEAAGKRYEKEWRRKPKHGFLTHRK